MAQLNNSAAYGFSLNVVRPVIMKAIIAATVSNKWKVEAKKSTNKDFAPINIIIKKGTDKQDISVVNYFGNNIIALFMYNMMYAKNIAFIADDIVYIVNGDKLRQNWQNIMAKVRNYTDGSSIRSEMTYADINKVIALAESKYYVILADKEKYHVELQKLIEGMKK